MRLAFLIGFWFAWVCTDSVDPPVDEGKEVFGTPAGQFVEWDVWSFVWQVSSVSRRRMPRLLRSVISRARASVRRAGDAGRSLTA